MNLLHDIVQAVMVLTVTAAALMVFALWVTRNHRYDDRRPDLDELDRCIDRHPSGKGLGCGCEDGDCFWCAGRSA